MTAKIRGQELGVVRVAGLLPELWLETTYNSGGPPQLGAVRQDDGNQSFVWSAISANFLGDENGNVLKDEDGNLLVG